MNFAVPVRLETNVGFAKSLETSLEKPDGRVGSGQKSKWIQKHFKHVKYKYMQ